MTKRTDEERATDLILRAFDLPRSLHRSNGRKAVSDQLLTEVREPQRRLPPGAVQRHELANQAVVEAVTFIVRGDLDSVFAGSPDADAEHVKSEMAQEVRNDLKLDPGEGDAVRLVGLLVDKVARFVRAHPEYDPKWKGS